MLDYVLSPHLISPTEDRHTGLVCRDGRHLRLAREEAGLAGVHHYEGEEGGPGGAQEVGHDLTGEPPVTVGQQEGFLLLQPQLLQQGRQAGVFLDVFLEVAQAGRLQLQRRHVDIVNGCSDILNIFNIDY